MGMTLGFGTNIYGDADENKAIATIHCYVAVHNGIHGCIKI